MGKLALAMIVKDDSEAIILKRALNSVKGFVDGIFITGTKEPQVKVKKVCKEFNAVWSWYPWDKNFSNARNYNFSQVPKKYEWILWIDTDDWVVGAENLKKAVEIAETHNLGAIYTRYLYEVEFADKEKTQIKNILIEHLRERIIKNDGTFEWLGSIHETLIEKVPWDKTDYGGFLVVQDTNYAKKLDSVYRNIEILENEVLEKPHDPRPLYYLAKAYFDINTPELLYEKAGEDVDSIAIELLKDYLRKSCWPEERAQAWEYLSMIYRERGEHKKAIDSLLEATTEEPKFPSIYIQLAICYVMLKDWTKALHWIKIAGNVELPKTTLVINPKDYKIMIMESLFHIYLNTGQLEQCFKVAEELNNLVPSKLYADRLEGIKDLKKRNDLAHWTVKIAHHLKETKQMEQLQALVNSIPKEIAAEPALVDLRKEVILPRTWEENEVVIFCGPNFERWSPKSTSRGIGGSEEAVINMGRELTKLGWKVTVFADPQEEEGIYDGVIYLPYYVINWKDTFNVFVAWRHIDIFDIPEFKAKKAYLWNHDIQNPLTYTKERVERFDKAFFLSKWHRDNVPDLPEDKVMITANGISI